MKVKILDSASRDLIIAYEFYEKQADGLGAYFIDSLLPDIDSLADSAGIHPVYFDKYHRALAKRFPFAIYYRVEDNLAVVYAILDCRRNPTWTREMLG